MSMCIFILVNVNCSSPIHIQYTYIVMSMCIFILVNVNCSSPIKKIVDMGQRKDQSFFMK